MPEHTVRFQHIVDPSSFSGRIMQAANAAGLNAFRVNTQSQKGVERGRAWVTCLATEMHARREGSGTDQRAFSDVYHYTGNEAADIVWALNVLRTGRTVEVGPGVGLRAMQNAVRVEYETVDYPLDYLSEVVHRPRDSWDLNPDYQRDHVWTPAQMCRFVGYFLVIQRMPLLFLNYGDRRAPARVCEVVDGKQRLTSLLLFTAGQIPAWLPGDEHGGMPVWWASFDEVDRRCAPNVTCARVYLPTREAVLRFYLNLNAGGTVHTTEEIAKVRDMLAAEQAVTRG